MALSPITTSSPSRSSNMLVGVALATAVVGAGVSGFGISTVNPDDSDALGLISALPWTYFVGMAMLIASFVAALGRERLNRPLLTLQLSAIVVLLYGVVSYSEDIARLPTTWVHAGFVDYIQRTGEVLPSYDARFVWPGFFATGSMLQLLAGKEAFPLVYAWTPVALNLLFVLPVWLIARGAGASARASWLAALVFTLTNWVAQDYYSPQGINVLLALTFLALLLHVFSRQSDLVPAYLRRVVPNRLWTWINKAQPGAIEPAQTTAAERVFVLFVMLIVFCASVASHQLTPFFLIIITLGLVVLDRVTVKRLPIFMLLMVFMWITYAATSFWSGQIGNLFGDVGHVGGVVDQTVNNRVKGDDAHLPVVYGRLLLTASVWLAAVIGLLRRVRRGYVDIVCLVGFIAPFAVLGGQAYGGEAMLRVYLFALPFVVTAAAHAFTPDDRAWSIKRSVVVLLVALTLVPFYFTSRYGNEAFEHFDKGELQIVQQAEADATPGSFLISLNSLVPTRAQNIENLKFRSLAEDFPPIDNVAALDAMVKEAGENHSYFIVTRAQKHYAELTHGQTATWADDFVTQVLATGRYRIAFENGDGKVIVPIAQKTKS